jgi:hypothetical protein
MKKIIFAFILSLSVVLPSYGMTVSEILDRVRVNVKDQSSVTSRQQFSDATLINFANDGQREANILAWLLQDKITLTLVSGTQEYALPNDFISTNRVLHNNVKLAQTSLDQLDTETVGWLASTGATPQKYYLYKTTSTLIGLVPKPSSPTVTSLIVYYIKQPIEITATSDTPGNGWSSLTPYHSALVYYITYRAFRVLEEDELAKAFYQEWASSIEMMRHGIYSMPDFNPGFIGQRK